MQVQRRKRLMRRGDVGLVMVVVMMVMGMVKVMRGVVRGWWRVEQQWNSRLRRLLWPWAQHDRHVFLQSKR